MRRIMPWATVMGLLGVFVAVYFMASTGTEEIKSLPKNKPVISAVSIPIDNQSQEKNKVLLPQQVAMLDKGSLGQKQMYGNQAQTGQDVAMINAIEKTYNPKHSALTVDQAVFDSTSKEILDDVWDRWLNIDEGYLNHHKHWHQEDRTDVTFDNFTNALHFFPADQKFSEVTAVCKNHSNYSEVLVYSNGKKWFDLNQERSNNYSVTLWEWYNTVAIKSGEETFIEHKTPKVHRWNATVADSLAQEILKTGQFEVYVEGNQSRLSGAMINKKEKMAKKVFPNLNIKATVAIKNIDDVRGCFGGSETVAKERVESANLNSDVLGLRQYFQQEVSL